MQVLQIEILDPKAEKLLRDLAEMDLIEIREDSEKMPATKNLHKAGWGKGTFIIQPSFDDPLKEFDEGDGIAKYPRTFG